jgi:hypothetical protein
MTHITRLRAELASDNLPSDRTLRDLRALDLAARTLAEGATNFYDEIPYVCTIQAMNIVAARAIEMVTDDGECVPLSLLCAAIAVLAEHGWACLEAADKDRADALRDAVEAGDVRADGSFIQYPRPN